MKLRNLKRYLVDPEYRFAVNDSHGLYDSMSDEEYLKKKYFSKFRKELDLSNPITFNEKLQWLKLYDRRPEYPIMVDKYAVKDYVAKIIGSQYIIPTIGVWDRFEDINFDTLPEKFVLKCTHDSGGVVIVRDKSKLDIEAARKKINRSLKTNYYLKGREWPYKNLKPRIIAEKYMEEKGKLVPEDYKVYCFNGEPKYIVCFHNRFNNREHLSETVYNLSWEPQNISLDNHFLVSNIVCQKPECLDELITICKKMCKNHIQVRLDFYIIDKKIYFGEITLFTASGLQPMIPPELDRILGDELDISELQNKASTDASSRLDAKKE